MTTHLTPEQFVDVAEGAEPESSLPHLAVCDSCAHQLADLHATMSRTRDADVPEPSPLFWDHLSSRVREAVAEEAARPRSWREWLLQPRVLGPALAGALLAALVAVLLPRTPMMTTSRSMPVPLAANAANPATAPALPPLAPFGAADDPQLTIVAAVATTVDWDEMRDEVTLAAGGDAVAGALTIDEQRELQRLLAEETAQPDAPGKRS